MRVASWWAGGFDLLLTPTVCEPPALLSELTVDPLRPWDLLERIGPHMAFTEPFNVTGQPAISLPLHWTPEGLPVGVQLVAAIGREDLLLRVASQLEREAPWSGAPPAGSRLASLMNSARLRLAARFACTAGLRQAPPPGARPALEGAPDRAGSRLGAQERGPRLEAAGRGRVRPRPAGEEEVPQLRLIREIVSLVPVRERRGRDALLVGAVEGPEGVLRLGLELPVQAGPGGGAGPPERRHRIQVAEVAQHDHAGRAQVASRAGSGGSGGSGVSYWRP